MGCRRGESTRRCLAKVWRQIGQKLGPLELGIAMAERFDHDWLILVPSGNLYANFISDLAGYDPKQIEEKVEEVIPAVMSWLLTRGRMPSRYQFHGIFSLCFRSSWQRVVSFGRSGTVTSLGRVL
jgi:hypothetical protein